MLLVLFAAAFVVPRFIDWNDQKDRIASRVENLTGRKLTIDGDIGITVLPTPRLVVERVAVSNPEWAVTPALAKADEIEASLALGPLFGGRIVIDEVRVVNPAIALERAADGRKSWSLGSASATSAPAPVQMAPADAGATAVTPPPAPASAPDLVFNHVVIENGAISYRDGGTETVEHIVALNSEAAAVSLTGPFDGSGTMRIRGGHIEFAIRVGSIVRGKPIPVSLKLLVTGSGKRFDFDGALTALDTAPKFVAAGGASDPMADVLNTSGFAEAVAGAVRGFYDIEKTVGALWRSMVSGGG